MNGSSGNQEMWALLHQGKRAAAIRRWLEVAEGLREAERWGDLRGIGRTLLSVTSEGSGFEQCGAMEIMAEAARGEGDWGEAERWAQRMLALGEQEADARATACAWVLLGQLAEEEGDALGALARWQCALAVLDGEEEDEALAEVVHDLWLEIGRVCRTLGQERPAQGCARRAEAVATRWQAA